MSNSNVMYEVFRDGVRATIQREKEGCSIILAPAEAAEARWAGNTELSGEMPEVLAVLAEAEAWLRTHPLGGPLKTEG